MYDALTMDEEDQIQRMNVMQSTLMRYNIYHWVELFMNRLKHVKSEQQALKTKRLDDAAIKILKSDYSKSKEALIFLDYDGPLRVFMLTLKPQFPMMSCMAFFLRLRETERLTL